MLMPASSEFVALCQAQIALVTQGLGAAVSIVYLTEELAEAADAKLVPVAAYPEAAAEWGEDQLFALLSRNRRSSNPLLLASEPADPSQAVLSARSPYAEGSEDLSASEKALLRQQQILLPLIYKDVVMGLLVTARADRAWNAAETAQIEQIAQTLAIACVLDQRMQWTARDLQQQQQLQEQKHDIFDDLLHQFRNPLTAVRTFGKLLQKRLRSDDTNRTAAEGIVRESDRLQELLQEFDQVLDLDTSPPMLPATSSHSGGGSAQPALLPGSSFLSSPNLHLEPHAIREVLEPLLESAIAIAQDRRLRLWTDLPPGLPQVQIDLRALREVLNNLIDNALKYTPAGGQIYISTLSHPPLEPPRPGNWQTFTIADTGPGIPPQDLEHLFERHYRGVQANTKIPGTGLGLAIARALIQQMQGEIQIFSPAHTCRLVPAQFAASNRAERPGTAFLVWLPELSDAAASTP